MLHSAFLRRIVNQIKANYEKRTTYALCQCRIICLPLLKLLIATGARNKCHGDRAQNRERARQRVNFVSNVNGLCSQIYVSTPAYRKKRATNKHHEKDNVEKSPGTTQGKMRKRVLKPGTVRDRTKHTMVGNNLHPLSIFGTCLYADLSQYSSGTQLKTNQKLKYTVDIAPHHIFTIRNLRLKLSQQSLYPSEASV